MTTAGALLAAAGADLTPLRRALPEVEPYQVRVETAPRWMRALWVGEVAAMTLPGRVYLRPDVAGWDAPRRTRLLVHELVHVAQWRRLGAVTFLVRYLADYLGGRLRRQGHQASYEGISLEREAREITARLQP